MLRIFGLYLLLAGVIFGVNFISFRVVGLDDPAVSTQSSPSIEQVRELAELVTLRVDVADVQETTLSGQLGSSRVALMVRGDVILGVDLTAAKFEDVDEANRRAILVLPPPRATLCRVDHDRTRVVAIGNEGVWAVVPGDDLARARAIDLAYADAQRLVTGTR